MSFKRNTVATYTSQGYMAIVSLAVIPLYINYMGAEAFGLVGFFSLLQTLFTLLDVGLSPLMIRQTALFLGGGVSAEEFRRLLRSLEGVFLLLASIGAFIFVLGSNFIATHWLNVQSLSINDVKLAVSLIGISVGVRWISVLYKGVVTGHENLEWLSIFNTIIATTRFILVLPVMMYFGSTPTIFFSYQLVVAFIELWILFIYTYSLLPTLEGVKRIKWSIKPLRKNLKFSLGIAFASSTWILFSQADKVVLSSILTLVDYGYFTLGVMIASGVILISNPMSMLLMPRLSKLHAEGDDSTLIRLYRDSTQLVAVIAFPVALSLAFFSERIIWSWTGDANFAEQSASVLSFYALGNCFMAVSAFPYYLQFAKGDIKLHVIGSGVFVCLLLPAVIWSANTYGIAGPGYAWLAIHMMSFIFWLPIIHKRFFNSLHGDWLKDLIPLVVIPLIFIVFLDRILIWPNSRLTVILTIALAFFGTLISACFASEAFRRKIKAYI